MPTPLYHILYSLKFSPIKTFLFNELNLLNYILHTADYIKFTQKNLFQNSQQVRSLKIAISQSKFLLCPHLLFSHLLCFRLVNVPHLRDDSPAHFQNFLSHMLLRWYFPHKLQNLLSPEPELCPELIKYKYIQGIAT